MSSARKASLPEDILVEARGEGVGQLVTEEAEVVGVEGSPNARPHLPYYLAEHIHKLTLIPHLNSHLLGSSHCCFHP